ncbi:hypothetical protein E3P99_00130 [Wallemia hederae]|uniref:Aminoacyl-transfer RNA synthetases class-II family profile domain-containing protein n=1 Tax=Wallemia hederae TaxID=1540922 RepID=A0A4T0FYH0_9BASI|nr:hypothetical protein E3P99_00130 [Wallemia hederae]
MSTFTNLFKRSNLCGDLRLSHVNNTVNLSGHIVNTRRLNKNLSFIDLRDHTGMIQLVVKNHLLSDMNLSTNSVVQLSGLVKERKSVNNDLSTGQVEVFVETLDLLNRAESLPFNPLSSTTTNDDLKLKHRYLDLRSTALTQNIHKRSKITHSIRQHLHDLQFTEIETPVLLNSSSEGAREFLVPTRHSNTPTFYALSQSPQQPKQLLIASGCTDAYFQIARCFRDEDGRKDRQPEFTQLDIEMAYVNGAPSETALSQQWNMGGEQVRELLETLIRKLWRQYMDVELPQPFPVMTYTHAMNVYGSDKPDLRFGLEIEEVSRDEAAQTQVRALVCKKGDTDKLSKDFLQAHPPSQVTPDIQQALSVNEQDLVWVEHLPLHPDGGGTVLGQVRLALAEALQIPHTTPFAFAWVIEFPLFTMADSDKDHLSKGRYASTHHPFTAPYAEDVSLLTEQPSRVRGQHYDLVVNGVELGGGSVRIHDAALQEKVFREVLKLDDGEVDRFHHLLVALRSGAPPHAGIALGMDRLMAIMCHTQSIRDTIAFPKSLNGIDRLFNSPSTTNEEVLKEYSLAALKRA